VDYAPKCASGLFFFVGVGGGFGLFAILRKNYVFLLSAILVEKLYVFVQLLQKYVRVKIKNSCLHNITGLDMGSNTTKKWKIMTIVMSGESP